MCVYLLTKFQVSTIILTSFRQGVISPPPPPPPPPAPSSQNAPLKSPLRLGLMDSMRTEISFATC